MQLIHCDPTLFSPQLEENTMAEFVSVPLLVIAIVAATTLLAVAFGAARRARRPADSTGDGGAYPYSAQCGMADDGGGCGGDGGGGD